MGWFSIIFIIVVGILLMILDFLGLAERGVRAGHIVMVAADDHRSTEPSVLDGIVECGGNLGAAFSVRIQNTGLRAHHQVVLLGTLDPGDIVFQQMSCSGSSSLWYQQV